ncbi:type II secretion system (T2SS) protein G [Gelidibacter algens]|jgi:hypothetical protein|uniref:Type II secretion system (T2SS) protein G n=1 Tax=Gelidibacter algens TaxID=49280 RepID=A0A1A7QX39_9FLAO|nr:type II secretion system protein GspG [Gelidibacter algens]OBX24575.1 hypothetical protein A9996_14605 [Gelidibacter algens]RAJ19717.1 type II secretion system (T2SS) protein G [Gelidibacter algens]
MGVFAGLLAEVLLIFKDFKFWLRRKKQRRYEQQHALPKKKMLAPSLKIISIVLVLSPILIVIRATLFLASNTEATTVEKLSEVALLLKHEKQTIGHYPEQLNTISRGNPLLKDVHKDDWNREFFYERHRSGESYVLASLGKDGLLNTEDDIKIESTIE